MVHANDMPRSRLGVTASGAEPAFATASSDQEPSVLKPQLARRARGGGAPGRLAAIFPLAGFGVRDTRGVANAVLIESAPCSRPSTGSGRRRGRRARKRRRVQQRGNIRSAQNNRRRSRPIGFLVLESDILRSIKWPRQIAGKRDSIN